MSPDTELWDAEEERRVRFLLGTLSEPERADIEERLFDDPDFHEELEASTDDLIRAYLAGQLDAEDRRRFELHFLVSPRRRERYEFVRALLASIDAERSGGASGRRLRDRLARLPIGWGIAAILFMAALPALILLRPPSDGLRMTSLPEETSTAPPQATASPAPRSTEAGPPGAVRHAATQPVRLPAASASIVVPLVASTRTVRFEVPVERGRHPTYDIELRTEGADDPVWQAHAVMPRAPGEPLVVDVPARVLVADAYELRVNGEVLRDAPAGGETSLRYTVRITHPRGN